MEVSIIKTGKNSFDITEFITRETFWNLYKPGCDEHLVLHQLRKGKGYIEELDIVAIHGEEIIGHIISTKARVIDSQNQEKEVLCVGPISVLPSFQNKGTGTKLMNHSIRKAGNMGYRGMILFGDPHYYRRFGFRNASEYEITTKDLQNFEPFMALELREKGLDDVKGRFFEDEAFAVSEEDLAEFEKKFPSRKKGRPRINISLE